MVNADKLFHLSSQAYAALYEAENSTTATLKQAQRQVEELHRVDPRCAALLEQLQTARIAVDDVALSLREYSSRIEANPKRLEWVEGRSGRHPALEAQVRKHGQRNTRLS